MKLINQVGEFDSLDSSINIAKTYFPDLYIKSAKQKVYNLFDLDESIYNSQYQKALDCINNKEQIRLRDEEIPIELIWQGVTNVTTEFTKSLVFYIKSMAGLESLENKDIMHLIN